MMKFENTEHYTATDRIRVISNELLEEYPSLSLVEAMKIASLCDIVFDEVTEDVIFKRYYNILLVLYNNNDKELINKVYQDMCNYCKNELKDRLNRILFSDIEKYFNGELEEFPILEEYYGND